MSLQVVHAYKVVCDEIDCTFETNDLGGDFAFWEDSDVAEEEWTESDAQLTAEGKHYCPKHVKVCCADCSSTLNLVNDASDGSGDWWCPAHLETQPEYPAPPGVVV